MVLSFFKPFVLVQTANAIALMVSPEILAKMIFALNSIAKMALLAKLRNKLPGVYVNIHILEYHAKVT